MTPALQSAAQSAIILVCIIISVGGFFVSFFDLSPASKWFSRAASAIAVIFLLIFAFSPPTA